MICCDCKSKRNHCSCSIFECDCTNIISCFCCLFGKWEQKENQLNISQTFINYSKEVIKIKIIPNIIKKDIENSLKEFKKVENSLNKINKDDYIKYIDSNYDPEYIARLIEKNNIAKLTYFISKLELYIDLSNILIEISKYLDYKNVYLKIKAITNEIVSLLPSIAEIFASYEESLDNSLEYEALKEKMYLFDLNLINLENKLEFKIT
ncbi:hypothetical protein [Spiroplasma cantharicola]|uniref:Uncharacterized protein n=1 Tax=Spiroplasma cantharicola TaxID=362837 RepID=A0A0M3SJ73_9MOLU|nr:hypothetical protein [Spiroplasma cantharicola]ALD66234.1 hypothetical protein SCANT_v1c03240 [Spiroplasma cantharicola]